VAEVVSLCRACADEVAPCDGLIADHLRSSVTLTGSTAWLVDGFGAAHPAAPRTTIGRDQAGELVVLAPSVSRAHAELRVVEDRWHLRDLGSRNGTFLDDVRLQGRVVLPPRAVVRFGDVALWFLSRVGLVPDEAPSLATGSAAGALVRFVVELGPIELCVVGASDPVVGGALLSRPRGTSPWTERGLAPLEFQLLRALCQRHADEAASPSAVRGCVATKQLARDLPFQSRHANEENVRQVVRRLRVILDDLGAEGLLAVAPGRGYYLAAAVTAAPATAH
jgi:hypothetical protein